MKTGAGDDPFTDDSVENESSKKTAGPKTTKAETGNTTADSEPTTGSTDSNRLAAEAIPWVLRRSAVKEDRDTVHQFFLREEYSDREDELRVEIAALLDMQVKDVKKLDLREAMVATADPKAIAEELREWGYEYLD
jgi:hypothetical protein